MTIGKYFKAISLLGAAFFFTACGSINASPGTGPGFSSQPGVSTGSGLVDLTVGLYLATFSLIADSDAPGSYRGSCPDGGDGTVSYVDDGKGNISYGISVSSCAFTDKNGNPFSVSGRSEFTANYAGPHTTVGPARTSIHFSVSGLMGFASNCEYTQTHYGSSPTTLSGKCVFTDSTGAVVSIENADLQAAIEVMFG